jgi:leader peptidase (prepilin peptidase)/N-methyltransferase
MVIIALVLLGLCFGSFVNALVWRIHEQEVESNKKRPRQDRLKQLSISKGRSLCPHCQHHLQFTDLIPLFSWIALKGKCRYCHKAISGQYPLVEAATALAFVASYIWWPEQVRGGEILVFGLWLAVLTGLIALLVYDLRWYLLPNRIMYPLFYLAGLMALLEVARANHPVAALINVAIAVAIGGGIFYILFQVSNGKWIGGGDVKLGWLLGLIVVTPGKAMLFIFLAASIGTIVSLPLLATKRLDRTSVIPFGPLLIIGGFIAVLFGSDILHWYRQAFLTI